MLLPVQRERKNENNFEHVYTLHVLEEGSARRLRELEELIGKLCRSSCEAPDLCMQFMPRPQCSRGINLFRCNGVHRRLKHAVRAVQPAALRTGLAALPMEAACRTSSSGSGWHSSSS